MKKSLGIYVHLPFCLKKCLYCDFCSFPNPEEGIYEAYTSRLLESISAASAVCSEYEVDTVYLGGGTPTLLPIACHQKLIKGIYNAFDVSPTAEISAECNPATADLGYLRELRNLGVNRLSIGLQSVHERELRALGRAHSYGDFLDTYSNARTAGFKNISADLMYGIPEQTAASFRESLTALAGLSPEHISSYCLKIEKGTPFYETKDSLSLPDEDTEYEMYCSMSEILGLYGYEKYEISNFAKKDRHSRHNTRYWQGKEYLGFGVAAHSFFQNERFGNSRDMRAFLRGESIECERSAIGERDELSEYIMLSMRLSRGIELSEFKKRFGVDFFQFYDKAEALLKTGHLATDGKRIFFTDKGFFVSNTVLADMLDFA